MNTESTTPGDQEALRQMIIDARRREKLTEKEVNERYLKAHLDIGISAPTAIMTRVRDKRKTLSFSKRGANILGEILKIDPYLLFPPESAQALLPIVEDEDKPGPVIPPCNQKEDVVEADLGFPSLKKDQHRLASSETESSSPSREEAMTHDEQVSQETTGTQSSKSRKVNLGFYETSQGLTFLINKKLTAEQMERLSLSIPEYMMSVEKLEDGYFCRGQVTIFPYQAELLMRAIYGAAR